MPSWAEASERHQLLYTKKLERLRFEMKIRFAKYQSSWHKVVCMKRWFQFWR